MDAIRKRIGAIEAGMALPEEQLLITQDNLKNAVEEVSFLAVILFIFRIEINLV